MAKTKIGKVGITPRGTYSNTKNYVRLDVVTENGSSYVCLKDCVGKAVTDTEYWQLVAEKGDKGDKPVTGVDYNTDAEKTEFKNEVVTETKTDIADYVTEQKTELNTYTETKKSELDEYESAKETELNTKATELTNAFNTNATSKTKDYNDNATAKTTAFNNNATEKITAYNDNATTKTNEFNENVDSIENELTELAKQMPWNTTEKQGSIHIEDSTKYSRNKLNLFGNLEQEKREGYNLFNVDTVLTNQYVSAVGALEKSEYSNTSDYIKVTANKTYLITFNYSKLSNEGKRRICTYNSDKVFSKTQEYTPSLKQTVVTPTEDGYMVFSYDINCTEIQCIEGTTAKDYEKYGVTPSIDYPSMPVVATGVQKITKIGKNYWIAKFNFEESGLKVTTDSSGLITVNGTPNQKITKHFIVNKKIKYGKYVLSIDKDLSNYKMLINIRKQKDFSTFINGLQTVLGVKTNVNITDKMYYQSIIFYEGYTYNNVQFRIQLEEGDSATEFEPYQEEKINLDLGDTELCKIVDDSGNVVAQDRIVYRNNKWQFEKNVEKIILNGTENWVRATALEGNYRFVGNVYNTIIPKQNEKANIICDKYITVSADDTAANIQGIAIATSGKIAIYDDRFNMSSVTSFKNELSVNNVTVYSPLMMSTYEDCTPEQSEVLNKLYKLSLQQGVNNIFVESKNGVTTELQLEYMQDLNSKLNQLEAMIVSNASEEVTQ